MDGVMKWLADRRIELILNPKPYDLWSWLGQRRIAVAPRAYFLWGYDIGHDMNVLALRAGPTTTPHGISGWRFDVTLERRGPPWRWKRVRLDWARRAEGAAVHAARAEEWQAERKAKAA